MQALRFDGTSVIPKVETLISEFGRLPSFRDLTASLPELSVKQIPKATLDKHKNALLLPTIDRLTDIADIEDGVNYCQQLIVSYPDHRLASYARIGLNHLLYRGFKLTNEIEYLNRAISAARNSLNTANLPFERSMALGVLIPSLFYRISSLRRREDFNESIQLFSIAVENVLDRRSRGDHATRWRTHVVPHISRALCAFPIPLSLFHITVLRGKHHIISKPT
jgi:hypothetical protein